MKKMLTISMTAIFLYGCGGGQTGGTIEFWQFWTDPKAKPVIESIVDQFEAENPGWTVNVTDLTWTDGHQKIVVAFGANNPPDLLELGSDWIAEFAAGHALAQIEIDTSKFMLTEPGIFEGEIYGQPWFLASRILFFNKKLLDQAKTDIPRDWPELLEACRKVDALSEDISGFGANSAEPHRLYKKFLPFVWSVGGDIIESGEIRIDIPEVLRALEFYGELTRCGRVETQRHLEDAFIEGKIGFLISGGWFDKRLKQTPPDFEYQLVKMIPEKQTGTGWSFAGGEYLVIPYKSKKKQAAQKLIEMITRIDNVKALCDSVGFGYPPHKSNPADSSSVLFNQLMSSRSTPAHPRWIYIETIIENMVEQVTLGAKSPQQAIDDAQTHIDETLNR